MSSDTLGFILGAVPGGIYTLSNILRMRRVQSRAVALAREHGEFLDMDSSENQNFDYLLDPGKFIKPNDGPGARRGKELLLSVRNQMLKRHLIGAALLVVGAVLGVGISAAVDLVMTG